MQNFVLPAREESEEAAKHIAVMCASFFKELIRNDIPSNVSEEMSYIYTNNLTYSLFTNHVDYMES